MQITMQSAYQRCRRLIAAGGLPGRAGQPTHIQLLMTLDQLRSLQGGGPAEAAWAAAAGPGYDCDATIVPVVTGHVDNAVLDQLTASLLAGHNPATAWHQPPATRPDPRNGQDDQAEAARRRLADNALRQIILARAADLLSGPHGLAAFLRTGLMNGPAAAVSLPLDTGAASETIPAHLRRLVITRDRCCRFPGCAQPPAACQPHHIVPRSQGGRTSLTNLLLLCTFHHLIAVHRLGLGHRAATRRDRHRHQPRSNPDPALPRPARPGRLTGGRAYRVVADPTSPECAAEFGRRNGVPGELVVRLRPTKVLAVPDIIGQRQPRPGGEGPLAGRT